MGAHAHRGRNMTPVRWTSMNREIRICTGSIQEVIVLTGRGNTERINMQYGSQQSRHRPLHPVGAYRLDISLSCSTGFLIFFPVPFDLLSCPIPVISGLVSLHSYS